MLIETERMIVRDFNADDVNDLHEIIEYGFCELAIHKVVAETIDSQKSVNLMEKLGMKREGVQRSQTKDNSGNWADLYLYGILRSDVK